MTNSITIREGENMDLMLSLAAKAGFKEVLIGLGSSDVLFRDDYQKDIDTVKTLLDKYGLVCGQTHTPGYHLTVSSEVRDDATETAIIRCIEASAQLGAKWTALHPRTAVNAGYSRTKSFEDNKADLDRYLEVAEKCGVGIAVENMPLYP